jgi:hypothetical protein
MLTIFSRLVRRLVRPRSIWIVSISHGLKYHIWTVSYATEVDAGVAASVIGASGVGTGAACSGATGVGVGVGLGVFSCSGGVGWLGVDSARNGTGTFRKAVKRGIPDQLRQ